MNTLPTGILSFKIVLATLGALTLIFITVVIWGEL